jgi:tetratricopeptide (TPR) repeat protein
MLSCLLLPYLPRHRVLRRSLEIYEKFYGSDHTKVIKIRSNLARLLSSTGRLEEAESLMRQVLRMGEERLGPDDPILGTFLNNLAQLLKSTDRLDEAASLSRRAFRAFELFRLRNGHEHPYAHLSQGNFRNILRSLGRTDNQIEDEMESIRVEVKKGDSGEGNSQPHDLSE